MGSGEMKNIPPPPPGFVLHGKKDAIPPPPPGFELAQPKPSVNDGNPVADLIRGKQIAAEQPSVLMDMAKAAPSSVVRGTANLVGLPGTISDALQSGGDWVMKKGYEAVTGEPPKPGTFFGGPTDETKASMLSGNPLNATHLQQAASYLTGGGSDYQPKTVPGEYVRTAGEFLPSAVAFGGLSPANLIGSVAVPAVTSETAGQMTKGTPYEPYARVAAALLGGYAGNKLTQAPSEALSSAQEIKDSAGYAQLKAPMKEARLTGDAYRQIVNDVWTEAKDFGLTTKLKSEFGGTLKDHLTRAQESGGASLYDLELLRRSLRNAAGDTLDPASQALSAKLVGKLDDAVNNLSETSIAAGGETGKPVLDVLKDAREIYRTGAKSQTIENAITKAQTAASGVENGLRIQFRKIADNDSVMRGFSEVEQKAIRDVSQGTFSSNAMRWLGTFGVPIDQGRNFLGSLSGGGVGASIGGALAGPVGATVGGFALPAVGTAAKLAAGKLTENQARIAEALVKAGPRGAQDILNGQSAATAAGREAILKALFRSQAAGQTQAAPAMQR